MQSLSVFLLALVLLPHSAALKCYQRAAVMGHEAKGMTGVDNCDADTQYCLVREASYYGLTLAAKSCDTYGQCREEGDHSDGGYKFTCCKGDFCNGSGPIPYEAPPTSSPAVSPTLLSSLVAVAVAALI